MLIKCLFWCLIKEVKEITYKLRRMFYSMHKKFMHRTLFSNIVPLHYGLVNIRDQSKWRLI